MGSRNKPFFRVTVSDSRRAPTGRFIETVGWYDPKQNGLNFSLNLERIDYWISQGAQPSDTVKSLIKKARKMPVEAVVGEVKEEEVPVEAMDADETAGEEADEKDVPVETGAVSEPTAKKEAETDTPEEDKSE